MKHLILIPALALSLAACDSRETGQTSEVESAAIAVAPKHSAQAFFDTTSFASASSAGTPFRPTAARF